MRTKTVEKVVKHSIVYGFAVTQPFAFYIGAQPVIHDKLLQAEELQYGENSEIVRHLQYKLNKLGHYEDAIDGVFGLLTEHAIKGFQSSNELKVTGKADRNTMKTLIHEEKHVEIDQIKDLIHEIDYGSSNMDVRKVQEVLFFYGYYQGSVDGIYGPLTENAIQQIKREGFIDIDDSTEGDNHDSSAHLTTQPASEEETSTVKTSEEVDIIQLEAKTNNTEIVDIAKSYIGTPYVWGGTSPNGFDCSGFIHFIFDKIDMIIPRTVNEIWNFSTPIDSASIGDLVFFETYQPGPSHLGVYLGNGDFIHAGSSSGVTVSNLAEDEYWQSRYLGAKRLN